MSKPAYYLGTGAEVPFTFVSHDENVAIVATGFFGKGKFGLMNEAGDLLLPRDVDLEPFMAERGVVLSLFLTERLPAIGDCIGTFLYGTLGERRVYEALCRTAPKTRTVRQVRWNDRKTREFKSRLWTIARQMVAEVAAKMREESKG